MKHFKWLAFLGILALTVWPLSAGLMQYEYQGIVSVIIQSGNTDTFFNRAFLPAGKAQVNGRFWYDSDWYTPTTGIHEIPALYRGVTANVIGFIPGPNLPILPPFHFENDVNADPSAFDELLGLLPGDMWNAYKAELLVLNGFHGLYGWFVGGMSTPAPGKWPGMPPFFQQTMYRGLAVGRLGDLNPNPLAFNFGMIGGWNWTTDQSSFYMIGFNVVNVRALVPEPGTFVLMGAGLLGVGVLMRRRLAH